MGNHTEKVSYNLTGYVNVFSKTDWSDLDSIINNVLTNASEILETPKNGDGRGEYVDLSVARFIVRNNGCSETVNHPHTSEILNILERANFVKLIEQQTKLKNLAILRMQLNSMKKNSFIGVHTDRESDPAYEVTALIRTTSSYAGGELCLYGDEPQVVCQQGHSVFLMDTNVEHEVKTVTDGIRNSLVVLLGKTD